MLHSHSDTDRVSQEEIITKFQRPPKEFARLKNV